MKVGKKTIRIGEQWFEIEIHYSSKNTEFTAKGLPSDFSTFSEKWNKSDRARTEEDLLKIIRESGAEYAANKTKSRKVIAIRGYGSTHLLMNKTDYGYEGYKNDRYSRMESSSGGALFMAGFDFVIATELDINGSKKYYRHRIDQALIETGEVDRTSCSVNSGTHDTRYIILDYTEHTHQYFINLAASFAAMVDKMADFFGEDDNQKVLEHIRSARLLAMPLHKD